MKGPRPSRRGPKFWDSLSSGEADYVQAIMDGLMENSGVPLS
jgi:hypothetical protein